jgi:hypothetical protein
MGGAAITKPNRQSKYVASRLAKGYRLVTVWLSPDEIAQLDAMSVSRTAAVKRMLADAHEKETFTWQAKPAG